MHTPSRLLKTAKSTYSRKSDSSPDSTSDSESSSVESETSSLVTFDSSGQPPATLASRTILVLRFNRPIMWSVNFFTICKEVLHLKMFCQLMSLWIVCCPLSGLGIGEDHNPLGVRDSQLFQHVPYIQQRG
jgi:hypothetical protein